VLRGVDEIGSVEISRSDLAEFQMFIRCPLAVFFHTESHIANVIEADRLS